MSRDGTMSARTAPPPRSLVHLFEISGPVRPFLSSFCLFSGVPCAYWRAVVGFGCVGRLGWLVWAFSGALKPTVRGVTVGAWGAAVVYPGGALGVRLSVRTLRRVGSKFLGLAGGAGLSVKGALHILLARNPQASRPELLADTASLLESQAPFRNQQFATGGVGEAEEAAPTGCVTESDRRPQAEPRIIPSHARGLQILRDGRSDGIPGRCRSFCPCELRSIEGCRLLRQGQRLATCRH